MIPIRKEIEDPEITLISHNGMVMMKMGERWIYLLEENEPDFVPGFSTELST